ncbi:uncharacterized protein LOC106478569 isoform X2 [Limulus polyphemus]|uniref:Uncharacterized protein LOC106478569 isoform X2 n=1 Tax=Limulus polyphemus TaxID=6850 RepID=A0ABM1S2N0_LIMPO|nr:uncharacterized protein LOC106478569 isoform X2 [Limulus polyphemus]
MLEITMLGRLGQRSEWKSTGNCPNMCKTSLLFQAAVTLSTKNDQVIFIRPKHLDKLPLHVHGMPSPKPLAMQHVKLMYMWSVSDLVQYLARIHMNSVIPAAILVDDLDHYVTQLTKETSTEQAFAKLGVLLKDAADFCSKKRDDQCLLLAACKLPEQGNLFHSIYEQFGDVWNINRGEVSTQRQNLFLTMSSNLQYKTFFYIEDEQIFLDKLTRKTGVFC